MPRIVIIGGGISGLSLAFRLQQRSPQLEIVLLEQADRPGGTTWTLRRDGFQIETGPNGFLDTKPTTLNLCREIGLEPQLVHASEAAGKNRYLFLDSGGKAPVARGLPPVACARGLSRLRLLPASALGFLGSDLLSWRGKLTVLLEPLRRRGKKRDESVSAFIERRLGREAAELFADALVTGIYAGDPKLLSLPATFPRLAAMEQQYGSLFKGMKMNARQRRAEAAARNQPYQRPGKMWSFPEGLRFLVEKLASTLKTPPLLGVKVRSIFKIGDNKKPHWTVHGEGKDQWTADAVILTCPSYIQAGLLAEVDPELADRISGIAYNRVAVVALGYRRQDVPGDLSGFGYIAPQRDRRDVLGVQWCSSIYPQRAPDNTILLRAMCGGWHRAEIVGWDDATLLQAVRRDISLAMDIHADPIFHEIIRWNRAIPQYHLGHLDRVQWIETRLQQHPGLFLGGNAYHGVSLNDCTEQGAVLAERVAGYLNP